MAGLTTNASGTNHIAHATEPGKTPANTGSLMGAIADLQNKGVVRRFPQPSSVASGIMAINNAARNGQTV